MNESERALSQQRASFGDRLADRGCVQGSMSVAAGKLRRMIFRSLIDVERAIRASWGADTCAPEDIPDWHPGNPARGQCGTTALVLNDLLGGDLMRGNVHRDGKWADYHWWNRVGDDLELDLTREQFAANELVGPGEPVSRSTGNTRLDTEYETLRKRVLTHLSSFHLMTRTTEG